MADFSSPFPESVRTAFTPNPIILAICQVRFPTVLRIGSEAPVAFQEAVRGQFPIYNERPSVQAPGLPPEFASLLPLNMRTVAYDFRSADDRWIASLTQDSLSLQTGLYDNWEEFRDKFESVFAALNASYAPSFVVRVGLRYQDLIRRSRVGLEDKPWRELLNPSLAAELTDPQVATSVKEKFTQATIFLNETDGNLTLNHGITEVEGEEAYLIDADLHREHKTETQDVLEALSHLKRHSGRFFRWCLTEMMSNAMNPQPVEQST